MTWEVREKDRPVGKDDDGRAFVTDGVEFFHVDRVEAQRIADLLNDKGTPTRRKKAEK